MDAVRGLARGATSPLQAIGIGITGPVDINTGIVTNPFTLDGWPATDIRGPFAEAFGVPVAIDNDANVAAVGEWWLGAGMGMRRMTMITIGTGVGVATLVDGQIQRTSRGAHGEAGHMVLDPNGPLCYCGARGCWEVLASGTSLDRNARQLFDGGDSVFRSMSDNDPQQATGALLFSAAAAGHGKAGDLVDRAATWHGLAMVNLASTVMPDVFVMSGGVMEHFERMRPLILEVLQQHAVMIPTGIKLVAATLGDEAGAVGAARQAVELIHQDEHLRAGDRAF